LNNCLARLLNDRGWSETTLAAMVGLSRSRVNRLKNRHAMPSVAEALLIAYALHLRVAEIFSLGPGVRRPDSDLSR